MSSRRASAVSADRAIREPQELVELALKGLLRGCGVEAPRIHDVSEVLLLVRDRLPDGLASEADRLAEISKELRRDLELAFHGAEDLTPSTFYVRADATRARDVARWVVQGVRSAGI